MFERFIGRARKAVVLAQEKAVRFGHKYIATEYILLGLVRESEGVAACCPTSGSTQARFGAKSYGCSA